MTEKDAGESYAIETFRQRITALSIVPDYTIASTDEALHANDQLGSIKTIGKDLAALKKAELAPLAQAEAEIREKFRPLESLLTQAEVAVKNALLAFQRAEAKRLEDERRAQQAAAAAEAARLNEQARRERERAEAKAAELAAAGKAEKAEAVLATAATSALAKEQVAAMLPAAAAPVAAPTKLTGLSTGTVWKGGVENVRKALAALAADESLDLSELVTLKQSGIDRLAALYKERLATKYPGLVGVPTDRVAACAR